MSKLLMEMHVAESYAIYAPKDSLRFEVKNEDSLAKYFALILDENKISEAEFKQSIEWYKSKPELLDSIYQEILTDLAIWQTRIQKN